jgi:hypothetical protein
MQHTLTSRLQLGFEPHRIVGPAQFPLPSHLRTTSLVPGFVKVRFVPQALRDDAGTCWQTPEALQLVLQVPAHAVLQQTPNAQWPLPH